MFDEAVLVLIQGVEDEFRNCYWHIRNARGTNWKAVNRTRVLAEVLAVLGVPRWAVKEGRYCLRLRVCQRCVEQPLKCHQFGRRARRGDFSKG
jgi:hypothetical protein